MIPKIETILIEESIASHPLTRDIIHIQESAQEFSPKQKTIADKDYQAIQRELRERINLNGSPLKGLEPENSELYDAGKKILVLKRSRGNPFRTCPGTQAPGNFRNVCCNYYVFNFLSGCPLNCSYCYLYGYLNQPALSMQVNIEDPLSDLIALFQRKRKRFFRVGTGEIADSLALPASDPLNRLLVEAFSKEPNALLEFKTKSNRIGPLLDLDPNGRVVVSWSLSPPEISKQEEHGTATPIERIQAAKTISESGYLVAFHLDPLIFIHRDLKEWKKDYFNLMEMIFDQINPSKISWISMGSLRFLKGLREQIMDRFPNSKLPYQEMLPAGDGKFRYPKPIRKQMFQFISQCIKDLSGSKSPPVYLCMESRDIWQNSLGKTPDPNGDLRPLYSHAIPQPIQFVQGN